MLLQLSLKLTLTQRRAGPVNELLKILFIFWHQKGKQNQLRKKKVANRTC